MRECFASDLFLASQRAINDAGFLVTPGVIAKANNVQTYRAGELGLDGDPSRLVRLYRPLDEVTKSAPTFEGAPVTNDHPPGKWINSDNWKNYAVGDTRNVCMVGDDMQATLTVRDKKAVDAIMSGKSGLSNGYRFKIDESKKTTPTGEAVDGWMVDIQGNHTAVVDRGRGGPDCKVADSKERTMGTRRVMVGKLPFDLDEVAAAAVEEQQAQNTKLAADAADALTRATAAEKRADTAETQVKELTTKLTAADGENKELKAKAPTAAQIEAMAEERSTVVADAAVLAPDLKVEGKTVDQIRREAITAASPKNASVKTVADAALGGVAIDKASADIVRAAFAAARSVAKSNGTLATDNAIAAALLGAGSGSGATANTANDAGEQISGYALYCHNLTHPKKAA
jgi:hypothetical protein